MQYRQAFGENFPEIAQQLRLPLQALTGWSISACCSTNRGPRARSLDRGQRPSLNPGMKNESGVRRETYKRFVRASSFVRDFEESMAADRAHRSEYLFVQPPGLGRRRRAQLPQVAERAAVRYPYCLPPVPQATLQPAEVASYFERHGDEFRLPPQRVVNYLLIDTVRTRAKMTFENADLEAYYNSHLDEFQQEEQVRARHILLKIDDSRTAEAAESAIAAARQRVDAGEDFAKLATELSDDPGSKARGGDLGFFGRGRMIKEFEEAAFNAEPNSLVGPIRTSFGYHLIQVLEKRAAGQRPFAEAEPQIRSRLAAERADTQAEARWRRSPRVSARKGSPPGAVGAGRCDTVMFITTPPSGSTGGRGDRHAARHAAPEANLQRRSRSLAASPSSRSFPRARRACPPCPRSRPRFARRPCAPRPESLRSRGSPRRAAPSRRARASTTSPRSSLSR
jgi:hypothetical protein